ncbi:nucleotidyl transferase AbiEii/AbiGii toxin family protein [Paraburkholderia sp. A3RO-2L]|uniref:nucleotidyl transferase AbiEii/AbiGii toxin family protein n=1 Tax=Paraburkholderia sp. A3RO-2L TaxID=3028376 RepID=UPI003DA7EAB2
MSQPKELRSGLWEKLLTQALTLMDEVATHGMSDPFFTFGGGTVLMLRHNHRLSKDIDLFVPSPQMLGYVSPRLSSVAEEICNGDYKESFNYVKLEANEGQIDVVASPNLLPDANAFETWQLFDRSVRVETAAEIVSKKMYHRGDQGTARDLFDLSLVIEREPGELEVARPFLYRHLDALANALESPSQLTKMKERFDGIMTLDYAPPFEHVVDVVRSHLQGLQARREQSAEQARAFVADSGLGLQQTDAAKGEYCGPIIHRTERHAVQNIGRNEAVVHDVAALGYHDSNAFKPTDALLRVRYQDGQASLGSVSKTNTASKRI